MTAPAVFEDALEAARLWHAALPEANAFCPWPTDLVWTDRAPHHIPATEQIVHHAGETSRLSAPLTHALQTLSPHLEWRLTYTAEEVGQHFLDHYGWFELAGPQGHFITHQTRITVGYWGTGLDYPRHQHLAEELYTIVSGRALFQTDGEPDEELGAEGTRLHTSHQPHALNTADSPLLVLVFWRGEGLADAPAMSAA